MSEYREVTATEVGKMELAHYKSDGLVEYIVKNMSRELAERIMTILESEKEIVVGQSDVMTEEQRLTNSVRYLRQIKWSPLIRCKYCKRWDRDDEYCVDFLTQDKNGFCSWGERREDAEL